MAKTLGIYAALIIGFAMAVMALIHFGPSSPGSTAPHATTDLAQTMFSGLSTPLAQTLMQVLLIIVAARIVGALFTKISQPAVIGEMMVGVALGPSVLGAVLPSVHHFLFPASSLGTLSMLSQVGVLLFMFVVGMELDMKLVQRQAHSAVLISHASIVAPFLLGSASAIWLFQEYSPSHSFVAFSLFMGISMSITAFPVLARILQERGLTGTDLGNTALTCAAIDDITAWIGLAFIVAIAGNRSMAGAGMTLGLSVLFFVIVMTVGRPLLQRFTDRLPDTSILSPSTCVGILIFVFASALFTEAIGLHALFGAFLAGIAMPKSEAFRSFLRQRLEYFSTLFLLPVFFAFTGLRTQVGLLSTPHDWVICGLLLVIAITGKFGGSALASRITGMSWRDSAAIGALMNARGLVELIVLNVGLDLGVLSPKIFAMLVLMALVTTFVTGPIVSLLGLGHRRFEGRGVEARDRTANVSD